MENFPKSQEVAEEVVTNLFEVEELEQRLESLSGSWSIFTGPSEN